MTSKVNLNKHDQTYTVYADPWIAVTALHPEPIAINWDHEGMKGCDLIPAGTPIAQAGAQGYTPQLSVAPGRVYTSTDLIGGVAGYALSDTPRGELLTMVTAGVLDAGTYAVNVLQRLDPTAEFESEYDLTSRLGGIMGGEYTVVVLAGSKDAELLRVAGILWEQKYKALHEAKEAQKKASGEAKEDEVSASGYANEGEASGAEEGSRVGDPTNPGGL